MERKRFTRRGILKLFSAGGLGAMASAFFPEFPLAMAAKGGPGGGGTDHALRSSVDLADSDPLLTAAMNSDGLKAIVARHGPSALSQATHATYGDGSLHAVVSSLTPSNGGPSRAVFAYFRTESPSDFRVLQMELVITKANPFTGHAAFLDHNDRVLTKADFANGKMVSSAVHPAIQVPGIPVAQAYSGTDYWSCLSWCLISIWPTLPWWIQQGCGLVCGACLGKQIWACGFCASCIGGYAGACIVWCSCAPWC
ncbi:MAG TPA: hypothetical protein VF383_12615 [Candidatus Dormibacteraeota bacterium]